MRRAVNYSLLLVIILTLAYKMFFARVVLINEGNQTIEIVVIEPYGRELHRSSLSPNSSTSFHFLPKYDGAIQVKCSSSGAGYIVDGNYYTRRFAGTQTIKINK